MDPALLLECPTPMTLHEASRNGIPPVFVANEPDTDPMGPLSTKIELVVSGPDGTFEVGVRGKAVVEIGRSSQCEVRVADGSVSRKHARLRLIEPMSVEDLGSHNGTRVDGKVLEPRRQVPLRVGAVLELGTTTVVVRSACEAKSMRGTALEGPVVVDPRMLRLYAMLDDVAPTPLPVLVLGETGVGKEHYARAVHERSNRASRPYLQINCAALHENLLEAELFGYERGAFTGAAQAKPGIFEAAAGGTVFLDEVGELTPATQAKLLRFLQDGSVQRLGSTRAIRVDVRVVSATNRDLRALVQRGEFRADLFYRLDGIAVTLPPLRERPADVVPLATYFARLAGTRIARPASAFSPAAIDALRRHAWLGNVRELKNVIERTIILTRAPVIEPQDLRFSEDVRETVKTLPEVPAHVLAPPPSSTMPTPNEAFDIRGHVANLERQRVVAAMEQTAGNQSQAARLLGISRNTLSARLKRYAMEAKRG